MARYAIIKPPEAITAAENLIRVTAPTSYSMVLVEGYITQSDSEASRQLKAVLARATTAGSGTAITIKPLDDPAGSVPTGMAAAYNFTTDPSLESDPVMTRGFNSLNGFSYVPIPGSGIVVAPGGFIVLRLDRAPLAGTFHTELIVDIYR